VYDKEAKRGFVEIHGGHAAFVLEEVLDRKERELTKAQEKEKIKSPWMYSYPVYVKVPSRRLCLRVGESRWDRNRCSWTDGKRQRVEECLNRFMAGMANAADADAKWKIEAEREALEQKERERQEKIRKRRKLTDERRLWALLTESESWQQSQRIREYVEAVKEKAAQMGPSAREDLALNSWISWALRKADTLDPLAPGSYCTREDRWGNPSFYGEEKSKPPALEHVWNRMLHRSYYSESRRNW
jgi:hypothetical protein